MLRGRVAAGGDISIISRATNDQDGEARSRSTFDLHLAPVMPFSFIVSSAIAADLGDLEVKAAANERGAGVASALALTDIQTRPVTSGSNGSLVIRSLVDRANAVNLGGGTVKALADVILQASGALHVAGPIAISADAFKFRDRRSPCRRNLGVGQCGSHLQPRPPAHSILTVDGDIAIGAHATNFGAGGVAAAGRLNLGAFDSVQLHNVTIDVSAIGGSHGGGPGALADASFLAAGHSPSSVAANGLNDFHLLSLDVTAHADSQGSGGAVAHAIGRMREGSLSIPGGIAIDAVTMTGRHGLGNASALASLGLDASSGRVTVGGPIEVAALAIDQGAGAAVASALQDITARSGTLLAHSIRLGPLSDNASAVNEGAGSAKALARTVVDTGIEIAVQGDIDISAIAMDSRAGAGASADAELTMDVSGGGFRSSAAPWSTAMSQSWPTA